MDAAVTVGIAAVEDVITAAGATAAAVGGGAAAAAAAAAAVGGGVAAAAAAAAVVGACVSAVWPFVGDKPLVASTLAWHAVTAANPRCA
jgi:hypothetical protein